MTDTTKTTDHTDESHSAGPEAATPRRKPVRPDSPTFADLGARPETVEALAAVGITQAFAIQEYALPIAMRGSDLIGQAPTGTGKTLGFGVPLLQQVRNRDEGADGTPQALVVVPTRELGLQVAKDLATAGATRQVRVLPIYGGVAYEPQIEALRQGVEILVGTPGRLLDLARQRRLKLGSIRALVLDEADRMLDLGFLEDVERILAMLPEQRQTMLFSATMPDPIVALARRFLRAPVTVHATHPDLEDGAAPQTRQHVYRTHSLNKVEIVARILQADGRGLTMIFSRTKRGVDKVASELDFRGFAVASVHGDLGQGARERALRAFRSGKVDVLVATDVAARGLDVAGVTHVINYDCPDDPDAYTHRIGRTGRAGATGVAVTFVDWEDVIRWRLIDKTLGLDIPEPPETYHNSDWLYTDLDIPPDTVGELPAAKQSRAGLAAEKEEDLNPSRRDRSGQRRRQGRGGSSQTAGLDRPDFTASADQPDGAGRPRRQRRRQGADQPGADTPVGAIPSGGGPGDTPTVPSAGDGGGGSRRRRRRGGRGRGATPTPTG
jgi:superfamily II DNA/RNA helicase